MSQQLAQRAARFAPVASRAAAGTGTGAGTRPATGTGTRPGAGPGFGVEAGRGFGGARYDRDGPVEGKRAKPVIPLYPPAKSYVPTRYRGSYADVFRHTIMTHLLHQVNENERSWTFYDLYSGPPSQNISRTSTSHIYREPRMRGIDRVVEWARDTKTVNGQVMSSNKLKKGHVFDTLLDVIRTVNATYKPLYSTPQHELEAQHRASEGFPELDESRHQTKFGLRSRLSNNFLIYPGNSYIIKHMMRKQDRATFLEGSGDFAELQRAHFGQPRLTIWERSPSDSVVRPVESPNQHDNTISIVDVLAGPVNTSQPIVWIDMGEHVDLQKVQFMPNTTTPAVRAVVNEYAMYQRGKELFDTLEPEDVDALIGPRGPDEMTDGEKEMQRKKEREERGEFRESWMPDFDNLVDLRDSEEIEEYETWQEQEILRNRKLRAGQLYMAAIGESQEKVKAPGWNPDNEGYPYNQYQHDRNWIATQYARKFLDEDPTSIICITYPIYDHKRPINLYRDLLRTGVRSAVTADFMFEAYRPELDGEYSGIGIVIANPPELFEYKLQQIVDAMETVIQKRHLSGDLDETKKGTHIRVPRVAWLSPVQNGDVEVSDAQLTLREPHETLTPSATNADLRKVLNLDPKNIKKHPNPEAGMGVRKTIQIREFVQRLHMMDESIAKRKQEAFFNDLTSFIQTQETIEVPGHITYTPATTSLSATTRATSTSSNSDATQSVTSTSTSTSKPSSTS